MRVKYTLVLLLLTGCVSGNQLAELRAKNPKGEQFNQILAAEYLAYAESLAEEGHPIRMNRFAQKGLDALAGENAAPAENSELDESRKALMAVLTTDVKDIAPAKAARAQLQYECWADGKKLCEEGFKDALADVQYVADLMVHDENDNRFAAAFDKGSAVLNEKSKTLLAVIAKRVGGYGKYEVELMAYANKPKATRSTKALAANRILAIEKELIARGVDAGRIHKHKAANDSEVFLSVDEAGGGQNTVAISIETFTPPEAHGK